MKKIFTVLTFLLSVTFAFSQHAIRQLDRVPVNKSAGKSILNAGNPASRSHARFGVLTRASQNLNALDQRSFTIKERLDSLKQTELSPTSGQWVNSYIQQWTYDSRNNDTAYLASLIDDTYTHWVDSYKESVRFDDKDQASQIIAYYWDFEKNQWTISGKEVREYNASGLLVKSVNSNWDDATSTWTEWWKSENSYNVSGKTTSTNYFYKPDGTSEWLLSEKDEYKYDVSGNEVEAIGYYFDGISWVKDYKDESKYDASNRIIEYHGFNWNETSGSWDDSYKDEYNYDASDNISEYTTWEWDDTQQQMVKTVREKYEYDNGVANTSLIIPHDLYLQYFKHKLTLIKGYYFDGADWIESYRLTPYYSRQNVSAVLPTSKNLVTVYPNPATTVVHFDMISSNDAKILIYNTSGQLLIESQLLSQGSVDVSQLAKGMYTYKIVHNGQTTAGKLAIR